MCDWIIYRFSRFLAFCFELIDDPVYKLFSFSFACCSTFRCLSPTRVHITFFITALMLQAPTGQHKWVFSTEKWMDGSCHRYVVDEMHNHHLTMHKTYHKLFPIMLRQWRYGGGLCFERVSHGDTLTWKRNAFGIPIRRLLSFFPLKFCFTSQRPTTISGMRVLVAWWNHHLSVLGINPSCQRRSMNSVSSKSSLLSRPASRSPSDKP